MLRAGLPKLLDLRASAQAVANYQLFPYAINQFIGVALPIVELALAVLFLTGLLTRYASVVFGLMLVAFIAGIAQAWARGLEMTDCGCLPPINAQLDPNAQAEYGKEILRDLGFMAMVVFLTIWPRSVASLDNVLGLNPRTRAERTALRVTDEYDFDEDDFTDGDETENVDQRDDADELDGIAQNGDPEMKD
jgi:uncharacterized membrane protein YphA (DoxX/SURF4 family)